MENARWRAGLFFVAMLGVVWLSGRESATAQVGGTGGGTTGSYLGISKYHTFGDAKFGAYFAASPSNDTGHNSDLAPITAEGQKLSGTFVEFTLQVSAFKPGAPPFLGPPANNSATITEIKVYILGGATPDDTMPDDASDQAFAAGPPAQKYRLATTYFEHDTDIVIRVTATFTFEHELYEGRTTTEFEYDENFTFRAWNLLQSGGTTVIYDEDLNPPAWVFDQVMSDISEASLTEMQTYGSAVNHGLDPSSVSSALNQTASQLVSKAVNATVMLGMLHGSLTEIGDSDVSEAFDHGDIQGAVQGKTSPGVPAFKFVAFWACSTFNLQGGSDWAGAYGIASPARAFLGFPYSILARCWTEEEWDDAEAAMEHDPWANNQTPFSRNVSHHVEIFMDHVSVGSTVGEARVIADGQVPMITVTEVLGQLYFDKVYSIVAGDYSTRLRYVYLTSAERQTIAGQSGSVDVPLIKLPIQ
jgi:hypothetical protein